MNRDEDPGVGQNQAKGQKVMDDTREGLARVREHVNEAGREARTAAGQVKGDLNDMAREAGETARDTYDRVSERVSSLSHQTEDRIREKPVQSALIALGIGFVAGLLSRRH
jgi:ElaB/YqjD/DUF883 family membrane-anchored ribosome-binding protein